MKFTSLVLTVGSWMLFSGLVIRMEAAPAAAPASSGDVLLHIPTLRTNQRVVDTAYRIAIGDLVGNVQPWQQGLLKVRAPAVLAGLDYGRPWTRDAAINASNAASAIMPDVARNTLLSVLEQTPDGLRIGGQYWDCIVWTMGAWHHYLYTGDKPFLALALTATRNSLAHLERTELDAKDHLFRGPGWSDGVAGYPLKYAACGGSSAILDWPKCNPDKKVTPGYGIPMKALSTNCLYYNAYITAGKMARELGQAPNPAWAARAEVLKKSINRHFWNKQKGCYRFLVGPFGPCAQQEGLGHAYALLFGIADAHQAEAIFENLHIAPAGIPCEWPSYPRYDNKDGTAFARHAGTVWPQIQGFWAEAAARYGRSKSLGHELFNLARHAQRDRQFAEIYHPITGQIYGGMQEASGRGIVLWKATSRQTWAATAYIRMILRGLAGMRIDAHRVRFQPCVPEPISYVQIDNLHIRGMQLKITIRGTGTKIKTCTINGKPTATQLDLDQIGKRDIEITLE